MVLTCFFFFMYHLISPWYYHSTFFVLECTILLWFYAEWVLKHTWKKCCFNDAFNLTTDFKEALHEKIKPSQPERKKNKFQWFLRSNHASEAVSFTLHSYHILQQKKDISRRNFPHNTSPNVFNVVYIWHISSVFIQKCFSCHTIHFNRYNVTFGRLFHPKWTTLLWRCVLSVHAFPGNWTMILALLSHHALQQGYSVKVSRGPVSRFPSQYYVRTIFFGIVMNFQ